MEVVDAGTHELSFKIKSSEETEIRGLGMDYLLLEGYEMELQKSFANKKTKWDTTFTSADWT